MLWIYVLPDGTIVSMQLEVDENGDKHEDCDTRIADQQKAVGSKYHYLVRVNMKDVTSRKRNCNGEFCYIGVDGFQERTIELCAILGRVWEWVKAEKEPTSDTWKTMVGF